MSNIKLKGATSGESIIKAPAVAGTNTTITLPKASIDLSTAGTDGQFLKTDGAGTLSFADASSGTALTGSTATTICTVTGANAIQGEANLKFNGSQLDLDTGSGTFNRWKTDQLRFNSTGTAHIDHYTTGQAFKFRVSGSSAADTTAFEIFSTGNVEVSSGNLVIGTAGKGIDFSATSDGTTMSSEILDDYEEGSFTATMDNSVTLTQNTLSYTKVGRMVHICGLLSVNSDNSHSHFTLNNLPFAAGAGYADLSCPATRINNWNVSTDTKWISGYTETNKVYFQQVRDNATATNCEADSGGDMIINLTYFAA